MLIRPNRNDRIKIKQKNELRCLLVHQNIFRLRIQIQIALPMNAFNAFRRCSNCPHRILQAVEANVRQRSSLHVGRNGINRLIRLIAVEQMSRAVCQTSRLVQPACESKRCPRPLLTGLKRCPRMPVRDQHARFAPRDVQIVRIAFLDSDCMRRARVVPAAAVVHDARAAKSNDLADDKAQASTLIIGDTKLCVLL